MVKRYLDPSGSKTHQLQDPFINYIHTILNMNTRNSHMILFISTKTLHETPMETQGNQQSNNKKREGKRPKGNAKGNHHAEPRNEKFASQPSAWPCNNLGTSSRLIHRGVFLSDFCEKCLFVCGGVISFCENAKKSSVPKN